MTVVSICTVGFDPLVLLPAALCVLLIFQLNIYLDSQGITGRSGNIGTGTITNGLFTVAEFQQQQQVQFEQPRPPTLLRKTSTTGLVSDRLIGTMASSFLESNSDHNIVFPIHWDAYRPFHLSKRRSYTSTPRNNLPSLSVVILFRLFEGDSLGFDASDLRVWMDYMRFAGVDHFFMYDNCQRESECQSSWLSNQPDVTYTPWSIPDYKTAQVPAYNHHLQNHFPQHDFEVVLDMDEFPFMPSQQDDSQSQMRNTTEVNSDSNNRSSGSSTGQKNKERHRSSATLFAAQATAGFRNQRGFLKKYAAWRDQDQVLMRTVFFGGPSHPASSSSSLMFPSVSATNQTRVLRYVHRRAEAERDSRTKPLYKPHRVDSRASTNLHEMRIEYQPPTLARGSGMNKNAYALDGHTKSKADIKDDLRYSEYDKQMGYDKAEDESVLRLNHYWCERLGDKRETLVKDDSIREIMMKLPGVGI